MSKENQNRRDFIKTGAAGFVTIALFRNAKGEMNVFPDGDPYPELVEVTITDLQAKMKARQLTSRRLVEMYLERIKAIDDKTRSVLEINPDALAIADQLDKERKHGKVRSMLHGIPVLIKDNIDTADKMHTTAGSLALLDAPTPKQDAAVAANLRRAGAVIMGKTNLSEWANFRGNPRGNRGTSGWSGRGGQTNNAYFLDQNPSGSSAGSGVAVSANLCPVAIGTETNGSIISPAVTNGIVGLKPTVGLVPRSGIIPISHSQDTAGPMTRNVSDAAILLGAIAGSDSRDPASVDADKKRAKDYTKFLDAGGLKGARLGVVVFPPRNADAAKAYNAYYRPYLDRLAAAGATLIDVTFPDYGPLSGDRTAILEYEFKADLNKYLAARGGAYTTLEQLIKFNEDNKDKELQVFGQEIFISSQKRGDLTDKAYLDAIEKVHRSVREDGIDGLLAKNNLDAFVGPTSGAAYSIAAVAGYPSITVPLGLRDIPASTNAQGTAFPASIQATGMLFFGSAWSEPKLITYAYAFEQLTKGRVTPQLLPTFPKKP
jgi:amidase